MYTRVPMKLGNFTSAHYDALFLWQQIPKKDHIISMNSLILCENSGSSGVEYEYNSFLGCSAV
jgi:hypothetical protein